MFDIVEGMTATSTLTVAAVCILDEAGRLLIVRKRNTSKFMLPGGKPEPGETMAEAAARELAEEIGIVLEPAMLIPAGGWLGAAANEEKTDIQVELFTAHIRQQPVKAAEIEELAWIHPSEAVNRTDLAPLLTEHILCDEFVR